MITKGIRGAITVEGNSKEALKDATLELLAEMFNQNNILVSSKYKEILRRMCHSEHCLPCQREGDREAVEGFCEESQKFPPQNDVKNSFCYSVENISHIIFTTTNDLNAEFPAKFARLDMGLKDTAMMCFHELDVPNSLPLCLRVLIVLNCEQDFVPKFVYLKGASNLR